MWLSFFLERGMQENMRGMGRNHGQACLKARFEEWETSLVTRTILNSFFASSTNLPRKKIVFVPAHVAQNENLCTVHAAQNENLSAAHAAQNKNLSATYQNFAAVHAVQKDFYAAFYMEAWLKSMRKEYAVSEKYAEKVYGC